MTHKIKLFVSLILFCSIVNAQKVNKITLHFDTNRYMLSKTQFDSLKRFLDTLKLNHIIPSIQVIGHTDNVGDSIYNINLSQKRAENVYKTLLSLKYNRNELTMDWKGENMPLNNNNTLLEKAANRRVEILVTSQLNRVKEDSAFLNTDSLFKLLQPSEQVYLINPQKDTVIECKNGTLISIDANSFNSSGNDPVEIRVQEALTIYAMLFNRLNTLCNNKPLVSLGMISVLAYQEKNKLSLKPGKSLKIILPTDKIENGVSSFSGVFEGHDSIINWHLKDSIGILNLNDFAPCQENWRDLLIPCHLFFCKIRELLFPKRQIVKDRKDLNQKLQEDCMAREQLLNNFIKKFGDINAQKIKELMEAKNKYSAYFFTTSTLGWTNFDYFLSMNDKKLTSVKLMIKPDFTFDTKMVFKTRKVILPGNITEDGLSYSSVPVGEPVYIITIHAEKDTYSFSLEDIIIEENQMIHPDFKKVSVEYIKEKLEEL